MNLHSPLHAPMQAGRRRLLGGGGGPQLVAKTGTYAPDFSAVASEQTLRSQTGWQALSSTSSTIGARELWKVLAGGVIGTTLNLGAASDPSTDPGTFVIGYDSGSTNHVFRVRNVAGTTGSTTLVVAATNETNCVWINFAWNASNQGQTITIKKRDATGTITLGTFTGAAAAEVARGASTTALANDEVELHVLGQRVHMFIAGRRVTAAAGLDLDATRTFTKGQFVGFGTQNIGVTQRWTDLYIAPLTINVQHTVTSVTSQIFWPGLIGSGRAVPHSGTYVGTAPTGFQYRVVKESDSSVLQDWAAVSSPVIGGGNWSCNCPMPLTALSTTARIQLRCLNDSDARAMTPAAFAVGITVLSYGQSNAANRGAGPVATAYTYANAYSWNVSASTRWLGASGSTTAATTRAHVFASKLAEKLGVPVGVHFGGVASQTIDNLVANSAIENATHYWDALLTELTNSNTLGYPYAMVWTQGEAEASQTGSAISSGSNTGNRTNYRTWFNLLCTRFRTQAAAISNAPIGVCNIGQFWTPGTAIWSDLNWSYHRETLAGLTDVATGVYISSNLMDLEHDPLATVDPLHFSGDAMVEANRRDALSMAKQLSALGVIGSYTGQDGRGPFVTGATRSGATITLAVNLNGAASISGTGLTNYEVSTDDFATFKTISSAAVSGSTIVITLSADPGAVVKVRSFWGHWPENVTGATTTASARTSTRAVGTYADGSPNVPVEPMFAALTSN